MKRAPEVLECHMVAGGFDYLVKTRVADMNAYRRFLGEVLLALPAVRETRTYAVMEEVKTDGAFACVRGISRVARAGSPHLATAAYILCRTGRFTGIGLTSP